MASLHLSPAPVHLHHESPVERWHLVRWTPPPRLGRFVAGLWYFEGRLALPNERHYPHGQLDLVLQLGPRYRRVEGGAPGLFPSASVSGLFLAPDVIAAPPGGVRGPGDPAPPGGRHSAPRAAGGGASGAGRGPG